MIDYLFPTTLYHADLDTPDDVHTGMVKYIDKFYDKNIEHLGFAPSFTGEILGDSQISIEPEFSWVTKQIAIHLESYIEQIGATLKPTDIHPGSDIYVPQSWPVVCVNGGGVGYHNHCQSHFSAVFYVRTEKDNPTGQLVVHAPQPNTLSGLPIFHNKPTYGSSKTRKYDAVQNRLVIFPSTLNHEVLPYNGILNRYSISYDILITTRKEAGNFCLVSPKRWVKI